MPKLGEIAGNLVKIAKQENVDYIERTVSYIAAAGDISDTEKFEQLIKDSLRNYGEEKIMTLAQIWIQQGEKKGKAEGKLEGARLAFKTVIKNLFKQQMSIAQIKAITGLSPQKIMMLAK